MGLKFPFRSCALFFSFLALGLLWLFPSPKVMRLEPPPTFSPPSLYPLAPLSQFVLFNKVRARLGELLSSADCERTCLSFLVFCNGFSPLQAPPPPS